MTFSKMLNAQPGPLRSIGDTDDRGRITPAAVHCRLRVPGATIAELIGDGHLHPVRSPDGRLWFDPDEVDSIAVVVERYRSESRHAETITVTLPGDVLGALDARAAATGADRGAIVRDLLHASLETPEA
ncbi:MAG: ribbon-helix-helix domain-containing protein [Actinomycetota bacterium]|nr:ribbon-helix-helix domain-containing protein [Actinomycetota bacterium]